MLNKLNTILLKYIPSYGVAPNEVFRIVTVIDPFQPKQIASAMTFNEIQSHWNQIQSELFPIIKKEPNVETKLKLLQDYLDSKKQ
eukprot:gene10117-12409_t